MKIFKVFPIILTINSIFIIFNCKLDNPVQKDSEKQVIDFNNKIIAYSNNGNTFHLINDENYTIYKTIDLNLPDSLKCFGICQSTGKDYLIFPTESLNAPFYLYVTVYDIKAGSIINFFPTGLDSIGAPRTIAANILTEPGLFYLYSHLDGLFSINFLTREINTIFEVDWGPGIAFYHSFNNEKIVINKYLPGINTGHHEIEFYDVVSRLTGTDFILNKDNEDSIQIDALAFSDKNVFLSIRKYQTKYIENYFGSYDLATKEFYLSPIILPWSINPYYLTYSQKRKEVYTVGKHDKLFIIDTSRKDYQIKTVIDLPGKCACASRLLLHPDGDVVFISSSQSNLIFVVDLKKSCVVKKISIDCPYLLLNI